MRGGIFQVPLARKCRQRFGGLVPRATEARLGPLVTSFTGYLAMSLLCLGCWSVKRELPVSMWTAITLIVIACVFGEALRKRWENSPNASDERLADLEAKIDRLDADLRDRVQTLERIVTDRKEDLKRQFDRLDKAS